MERAAMTTEEEQPSTESTELRRQETEFYEALLVVLAAMPRGSTLSDALASEAGQRARRKWTLKYGRQAPL
jgi:hypothetical protein